ncbi:hypothetical protein DWB77_06930 [Streptomyces hundungensis]|uniref:Uncharacterized protein n=1 Tax=Streptomyces hundungensis TaxID=1077946 RepID=A0A387HLF0_9ACTN|nr:hypothetical protein DWB77_06930 [Streptomyces hundungensis]
MIPGDDVRGACVAAALGEQARRAEGAVWVA